MKTKRIKEKRWPKALILLSVGLVLGLGLGFWAGVSWPNRTEVSFYAYILEDGENNLLVEGIPENDVNHRGQSYIGLSKLDTKGFAQKANGDDIEISELEVGDLIRVIYDGMQMESYPTQIPNVWRIELTEPTNN